ncbi:transposase family protein [Streptomyces sp. IBSNAI002]|uniref:transposase family protein n=1 Tax=Streptomyces sp. IBSNAI002 TaxID=3457500 RepID=UPI003FCFA6B6
MCRQSAIVCLIKSPSREHRELPGTAARLASLPDPRARRGRRHSLASVLLTAACAVLAGARSYLAIGQWARHAPQDTLSRLGFHPRGPLGLRRAASVSTVRRVLAGVCPGGLADLLGHSLAGTESVAVDGKAAPRFTHRRGSGRPPPVRRHGRGPHRQPAQGAGQNQ